MRTLADSSASGRVSTVVPRISFWLGGRISSQRPGTMCSVKQRSISIFCSGSSTVVARPRITTER
jgi:hypothetical protein